MEFVYFYLAISALGCFEGYEIAKTDSKRVCLNESCPIQTDMDLFECTKSCSQREGCYLFEHKNVGRFSKCFLYGFDENDGSLADGYCENTIGTTCCQKGNTFPPV